MQVVVTKPAFYNGSRVRPGTELEVPSDLKGTWFAKKNAPEAKAVQAVKPAKAEPKALSQIAKRDKTFIEANEKPQDLA